MNNESPHKPVLLVNILVDLIPQHRQLYIWIIVGREFIQLVKDVSPDM